MTEKEIAQRRLRGLLLSGNRSAPPAPAEVVRRLGAVQAQDYHAALWAIGLRSGVDAEGVEGAIGRGEIVRTWPMRGTIHFVPGEDVVWMSALLARRFIERSAGRYRQLELDDEVFDRSRSTIERALQGGRRLARPDIYRLLEESGIDTSNSRGLHILGHLAHEGLICFGPRSGKQPTFVLVADWVTRPRRLEREEGLAEVARRYVSSHGPVTLADFMWWTGLRAGDARLALELVDDELERCKVAGAEYWYAPDGRSAADHGPSALLPAFDEFLVAYRDRSAVIEPAFYARVNAGGGLLKPTLLVEGRLVGTWRRVLRRRLVTVEAEPFAPPDPRLEELLGPAARAYGQFLGLEVALRHTSVARD